MLYKKVHLAEVKRKTEALRPFYYIRITEDKLEIQVVILSFVTETHPHRGHYYVHQRMDLAKKQTSNVGDIIHSAQIDPIHPGGVSSTTFG